MTYPLLPFHLRPFHRSHGKQLPAGNVALEDKPPRLQRVMATDIFSARNNFVSIYCWQYPSGPIINATMELLAKLALKTANKALPHLPRLRLSRMLRQRLSLALFKALPTVPLPELLVSLADSLMDQTLIPSVDFDYGVIDFETDTPTKPLVAGSDPASSLSRGAVAGNSSRRTTNYCNITEFIDLVYDHAPPKALTLNGALSRQLLEEERLHDLQLAHKLSVAHGNHYTTKLRRVRGVQVLELAPVLERNDNWLDLDYTAAWLEPYNQPIAID